MLYFKEVTGTFSNKQFSYLQPTDTFFPFFFFLQVRNKLVQD